MIYKVGMLCKHFKGKDLLEKNIYRIEKLGVNGTDIDKTLVTYTGDNELDTATNLVVYSNIFQDNKLFCREYEDISSELTEEKKLMFHQNLKVQPLTLEEIELVNSEEFIREKSIVVSKKFEKRYWVLSEKHFKLKKNYLCRHF